MVTYYSHSSSFRSRDALTVLDMLQICAAVVCFLACLSLPRRPVVMEGGTQVDGQYTVSAFGRHSFTWAGITLVLARNKKTLGLDDLPKLHVKGRSAYRQEYFDTLKTRDQLWKTLLFAHLPELLFQTLFAILQSAATFVPQVVMYQFLKRLELRTKGESADLAIWGLVVALGMAIILTAYSSTWLTWILWARLGQPIRTEVSAMIFGKATRRKDVKGMQKSKQATDVGAVNGTGTSTAFSGTDDQEVAGPSPGHAVTAQMEDSSEEDMQKSRQSTINLVVRLVPYITRIRDG